MNPTDIFPPSQLQPQTSLKSINNTKLSFMSAPGFNFKPENEALPLSGRREEAKRIIPGKWRIKLLNTDFTKSTSPEIHEKSHDEENT